MSEYRGLVDGEYAFGVWAGDPERSLNEAMAYASQYASEGTVTVQEKVGRKWVTRHIVSGDNP